MSVVARNIDSRSRTGISPGVGARVTAVRFFVSSGTLPPAAERKYDDLFFYNAARFIHWEMQVVHPAPGQPRQLTVTDMWAHMRGLGEILHRDTRTVTVEPHWTQSWVTGSASRATSRRRRPASGGTRAASRKPAHGTCSGRSTSSMRRPIDGCR